MGLWIYFVNMRWLQAAFLLLLLLTGCIKRHKEFPVDTCKPKTAHINYIDSALQLYLVPDSAYKNVVWQNTFDSTKSTTNLNGVDVHFEPLGYEPTLQLGYTHTYSKKCVYHTHMDEWKFAEVCFPNSCLNGGWAYAKVTFHNTVSIERKLYLRIFYQNTSYAYPLSGNTLVASENYLDNYYGTSVVVSAAVAPNSDTSILIPYKIGLDPKNENPQDPHKIPARPGNYEFALISATDTTNVLLQSSLDLQHINPFYVLKRDATTSAALSNQITYVASSHFKFVFLDEYFDGTNDLTAGHIYVPKDRDEKKLCDTCTGYFKAVIHELWDTRHFFTGFIRKAVFTKAEYGIRKENVQIDTNGILLTMPASKRGDYKRTWGEFTFGQSFKYGHLTVRAKFAQILNRPGSPNGIIHNLWLYEADPTEPDSTNPYKFKDHKGKQPYEIDFEFWSSIDVETSWDDAALIHYAVVDYMRDTSVLIKPNQKGKIDGWKCERLKPIQLSIPTIQFQRDFFNEFHNYELIWTPKDVKFLVDGKLKAYINSRMAKIPDKHLFLWIGSPMYQDGTYYAQQLIPFLKTDKYTLVDYIKIE